MVSRILVSLSLISFLCIGCGGGSGKDGGEYNPQVIGDMKDKPALTPKGVSGGGAKQKVTPE